MTRNAAELLAMTGAVNAERKKPEAGVVWWLYAGREPAGQMVAGVRGERGVLVWSEPTESFLPDGGANDEDVDYFTTWEGHHDPQQPGSEIPIELVYQAVTEYVSTNERPTCVEWVPAPDPTLPAVFTFRARTVSLGRHR